MLLLSPQDADDVAQEAFIRALDRLDRVESVAALGPFLKGVARNVVRERRRKYARESRAYARLVEDRSGTPCRNGKSILAERSRTADHVEIVFVETIRTSAGGSHDEIQQPP